MRNLQFFHLLLSCSKNQGKALLETADREQVASLVNLIYNIVLNSPVHTAHTKKLFSINYMFSLF